ncbi:MAG: hypothetical protein OXI92_00360 [Acidobacteriota bacterium]|nr:hypothetical protein [Acidobacteriota bacterium]
MARSTEGTRGRRRSRMRRRDRGLKPSLASRILAPEPERCMGWRMRSKGFSVGMEPL